MNELLTEIEEFSYKYLLREEIAIILGISIDSLSDADHEHGKAFLKGRYRRKAEFNNKVIMLSNQLSSPAMNIEQKIAEDAWLNDKKKR